MTQPLMGTSDSEIRSAIQVLERRDLDNLPVFDLSSYTKAGGGVPWGGAKFDFLRVKAIARNLAENKADVERFMMEDVLAGLHGLKAPFIYLIIGTRLEIKIFLGILNKPVLKPSPSFFLDVLAGSLESTFPDIEVEYLANDVIDAQIIQFFKKCHDFGLMSGIPTAKLGVEEQGIEQIERLIRGLYREEFGYMVVANPIADQDVVEAFDDITQIIRDKSILIKEARQYTQTSRLTMGGETLNRSVQYFVELLESLLEKLKLSKAQGMWRTMSYFFSPNPATAGKMSSLLKTVFSGDQSVPEAIRTIMLSGSNPSTILSQFKQIELDLNFHPTFSADHPLRKVLKHKFVSALSSRDLSTLTHLPKEEMPGYDVKDTARFGVCLPEKSGADNLLIGEILDRGSGIGHFFGVPVQDLVKHGLIVGVTGSGKTNTCLNLLDQLWKKQSKIPFLVIEPAKNEYRVLLNIEGFEEIQIFTLGDEITSPFRLNPFEVLKGVNLQTHIDNLRAVFNASFVMYAPMPYVLERCIHEIYQDKGWDLTTNENRHLDIQEKSPFGLFPTLSDLYNKIDNVVDAMGYEDRIAMDIKAGLKARVGSLRMGGKGSMLDTAYSIPMDILLQKPTVLELQNIGDDEEKAFIMALLIARLYEYRQVESKKSSTNKGLKHLTIIEEAHRLLSKTSTDFSNLEQVSTKGKAVEAFCNILSEIRAFGEGIFIAEQIPTKLAQDAIKNSNLKVMHRIVAKDDRDLMGQTMNLNEKQNSFVSILETGNAVSFAEGYQAPFLVKVPLYLSSAKFVDKKVTTVLDSHVRRAMVKRLLKYDTLFGRHEGCRKCQFKCAYRDMANYALSKSDSLRLFTQYVLAIIENSENFTRCYPNVKESLLSDLWTSCKNENEANDLIFCILITACERFLQDRAKKYSSSEQKINQLFTVYFNLINSYFTIPIKSHLSVETETFLKEFRKGYEMTFAVKDGPFPGCNEFCKYKCLFRYDVETLVKDVSIDEKYKQIIRNANATREKAGLRKYCMELAQSMTIGNSTGFVENIALCFFIQKSVQDSVQEVLTNVKNWFFTTKEAL